MNKGEKMRMCPYCEGTNIVTAKTCRFCASILEEETEQLGEKEVDSSYFQSPYNAPYAPNAGQAGDSIYYRENEGLVEEDEEELNENGHIVSLMLLSCGCMLLTISMLLFFFSHHGRVVLEWKSRYWSLYLMIGLPMVYYGLKKLRKIE